MLCYGYTIIHIIYNIRSSDIKVINFFPIDLYSTEKRASISFISELSEKILGPGWKHYKYVINLRHNSYIFKIKQ